MPSLKRGDALGVVLVGWVPKNPGELLSGCAGAVPDAAHGDAGSATLVTRESNASKSRRTKGSPRALVLCLASQL